MQERNKHNGKNGYDFVNPTHYKKNSIEVIDMMVAIHGPAKVADYCEITAFKYRMRMGHKPDQPIEREMEKVNWYEAKAVQLRELSKNIKVFNSIK